MSMVSACRRVGLPIESLAPPKADRVNFSSAYPDSSFIGPDFGDQLDVHHREGLGVEAECHPAEAIG